MYVYTSHKTGQKSVQIFCALLSTFTVTSTRLLYEKNTREIYVLIQPKLSTDCLKLQN